MAKRDDKDKPKFELIPPSCLDALSRILTFGTKKYAERNWENGLYWSRCIAPLKRHLNAFEKGEDLDPESGLLHLEHLLANVVFLIEYHKTHPELDDRPRRPCKRIGLDIDDVLADFIGAYKERFQIDREITSWHFDRNIHKNMKILNEDKDFWMGLKPKTKPSEIPFEPHCYITSRSIPVEWTIEWLNMHGFPTRPVISVGFENPKAKAVKEMDCQWFVDDKYDNFLEINALDGVCCFLLTTPQNKKHDVGFLRINAIADLPK